MQIYCTYEMIINIQAAFEGIQNNSDNEFHNLYSKSNGMAERVSKSSLAKPCMVG